MARVFMDKVMEQIYRSPSENAAKVRATKVIKKNVENALLEMRREFEEHPVTKEIDGGIAASNISNTLLGRNGPQNLFSFIGFDGGSDPLHAIRQMFDNPESMGAEVKYVKKEHRKGQRSITYIFEVKKPKIPQSVLENTKIPWAEGWSWVDKIETGIPGFANFLAKFGQLNSRSGGGVQVKKKLRSSSFKPPANGYLHAIFKSFQNKVKQSNRQ